MNKKTILLFVCFSMLTASKTFGQWAEKTPNTGDTFWQIDAPTKDSVYLLTAEYKLLRTYDGGDNWTEVTMPAELFDPNVFHYLVRPGLVFTDGKNGYVYGSFLVNGGVFLGGTEATWISKTVDGGETWESLDPIMPDSGFTVPGLIKFFTPERAVAFLTSGYGFDYVKTTDDGGKTWTDHPTLPISAIEGNVKPDGSGTIVAYDVSNFTGPNVLYSTQDFGASWTYVGKAPDSTPFPSALNGILHNFAYMNDAQNGFLITQTGANSFIYEWHISRTQDGGQNWSAPELSWEDGSIEGFTTSESVAWVMGAKRVFRREALTNTHEILSKSLPLSVNPNLAPGGSKLKIQMPEDVSAVLGCRILGSDGRLVAETRVDVRQGSGAVDCPVLAAGLYFLELFDAEKHLGVAKLVQP